MGRVFKWFGVVSFTFLLLIAVVAVVAALGAHRIEDQSVLHVVFDGEIPESPQDDLVGMLETSPSPPLHALADGIRAAADDDRIVGLLLEIKAPNVGPAQIQEIEAAMADFRASDKPSIAFLETAGEFDRGNAAYVLATSAGRIVLSPPGDVNLIGLRATVPFLKGTLDKLRIDAWMWKRGEYKSAADTFTNTRMAKSDREALQAVVDDMQAAMIEQIAARRGVEVSQAQQWVHTGPHLATEALQLGMVDELAYADQVRAKLEEIAGRPEPLLAVADYARGAEAVSGKTIALIIGEGEVTRGDAAGGTMASDAMSKAFRDARDEEVSGVLFRVNSPGGSYVASDLIRREVEVTREAGIPVVVSMGDLAASGGYFVAMGADSIVAHPSTITGSIGVFAGRFDARRFWNEWLGVTFDSYQAAPHADFFSWLDPPSPENKAHVDRMLDRIYDDFVTKAASGREMTKEALDAVGRGRIWSGRAAKEHGLVDELGGIDRALAVLKTRIGLAEDAGVRLMVLPQPKSPLELIGELLSQQSRTAAVEELAARAARRLGVPQSHQPLSLPFEVRIR